METPAPADSTGPKDQALIPTLRGKPPFPDVVDNTQRSDFIRCPTKWIRSFGFHLAPIQPSVHLHAGGAFAFGLEKARKAYWEQHTSVAEAKRIGLQSIIEFYGPFIPVPTKTGDKSLENVIKAFDSYMQRYPLDSDPIKPLEVGGGKRMIEFRFAIPTEIKNPSTGNPILYGGRSDMIGELFGSLFVTDEKTTGSLGDQWSQNWILDSQMTGYVAAARLHGYPVAGALIRGIGLLKTKITHSEAQVYRNQYEVDRWWNQLQRDLKRMVQQYEEWDFDLALDKATCNAYGGCAFVPLCNSIDPEKWMNLYRIRKWDPLAKDQGEELLKNPAMKEQPNEDLVIDLKDLM